MEAMPSFWERMRSFDFFIGVIIPICILLLLLLYIVMRRRKKK